MYGIGWNALRPEQAEILKLQGIKTVENLAALNDTLVARIQVPNLRELKRQAQMFIDSADQMRFAARLDEKDKQLENLQASQTENLELIAEQREQIKALMGKVDALAGIVAQQEQAEPVEAKRGPGRPRKEAAAA